MVILPEKYAVSLTDPWYTRQLALRNNNLIMGSRPTLDHVRLALVIRVFEMPINKIVLFVCVLVCVLCMSKINQLNK